MEKSIENIWQEGFLRQETLVAPKINDLYNQKSQHAIDRFKRLGKKNLQWIVIGGFIYQVLTFFLDIPLIGAVVFVTLLLLVVIGRKEAQNLAELDTGSNSYEYLKSFQGWQEEALKRFARIYQFVYPILFLAVFLGTFFLKIGQQASIGEKVMNNPDTFLWMGLPVYWIVGLVILVGLVAYFSNTLYRFDINLIYGRTFRKIDELITEMEELRQ
ncbi:MAG: hypothetical protein JXQ90_05915 [Cyclobacteriaceae bacterium]